MTNYTNQLKAERKQSIEPIKENNDQNREQVSQKIEDKGKEIENKVETNTSLSENKSNRDKEKMMHIEVNIKGVKKQIIKKTKKGE